jgi:hypothetical protein
MRIGVILVLASVFLSSGCAQMIASCGKDIDCLHTRKEAHALLGEPAAIGIADELNEPAATGIALHEEFHPRMPIAEDLGYGYVLGDMLTLGTLDLCVVPFEIYVKCRKMLVGQTICVNYDASNAVKRIELDGHPLHPSFP